MSRAPFHITSLDIRNFPGVGLHEAALVFEKGEFCDGINIITGPNGSGKSTTARAIRAVLWPDPANPAKKDYDLGATFSLANEEVTVIISGPNVKTSRGDGNENNPLDLPGSQNQDRYRLALHDLLKDDDADTAKEVQTEIDGSYNLNEAAIALKFDIKPSFPEQSLQQLKKAQQTVISIRDTQGTLRDSEKQLSELNDEIENGQRARHLAELADILIGWKQTHLECDSKRSDLDQYDVMIFNLDGNEITSLNAIESEIRTLSEKETLEQSFITHAGADLMPGADDTNLNHLIEDLSRHHTALATIENDLKKTSAAAAHSHATERATRAILGGDLDEAELNGIQAMTAHTDFEGLARDTGRVQADRAAMAAVVDKLTDEDASAPGESETIEKGITLLGQWLAAHHSDSAPEQRKDALLLGALGLGALVGALGAFTLHLAFWGVPAFCAALITRILMTRRTEAPHRDPTGPQAAYTALDLESPTSWNAEAVIHTIQILRETSENLKLDKARDRLRAHFISLTENLATTESDLNRKCAEMAEKLGRDTLDANGLNLFTLTTLVSDWHRARTQSLTDIDAIEKLEQKRDTIASDVATLLESLAQTKPADAAAIATLINDLRHILEKNRTRREIDRAEHRRRELFDKFGLDPESPKDSREKIARWLENRPAAEAAKKAYAAAHIDVKKQDGAIEQFTGKYPHLEPSCKTMKELSVTDLERVQMEQQSIVTNANKSATIAEEIRGDIKAVKLNDNLEKALANRDRSEAHLVATRDEKLGQIAGDLSVQHIRDQSQKQSSDILQKANDIFNRITGNRYELRIKYGKHPEFKAHDNVLNTTHGLNTLSSGTRVQLLTSLRLAYLEISERHGPKMPIIFDELLANSDDTRAKAIIDAAIHAAEGGRQVFYFTAQADEVGKWSAQLKERNITPKIIRLPIGSTHSPLPIDRPEPMVIPVPNGESHLDYGRKLNDLKPFEPHAPDAYALHLWYLIDDNNALHALMHNGYSRWGQIYEVPDKKNPEAVFATMSSGADFSVFKRAQAKAKLIGVIGREWRKGHGKPLDRGALISAHSENALPETFLDVVIDIAERYKGDTSKLVAELSDKKVRPDGFGKKRLEKLQEWLIQNGYLADAVSQGTNQYRIAAHELLTAPDIEGILNIDDANALIELFPDVP